MYLYQSFVQLLDLLALSGKTNNYKYKQAITILHDKYSPKKTQKGLEKSENVSHSSIMAYVWKKWWTEFSQLYYVTKRKDKKTKEVQYHRKGENRCLQLTRMCVCMYVQVCLSVCECVCLHAHTHMPFEGNDESNKK